MEVGFIGLGNIGAPCAGHLLDAGHRVTARTRPIAFTDRTLAVA